MHHTQSIEDKIQYVRDCFAGCEDPQERYRRIIELGRTLEKLPQAAKVPSNRIEGCQSQMYLVSRLEEGRVHFAAESDALISAGLAAIMLTVYNGESPETIVKFAPTFLEELGISNSISPNRANGLHSLHLRMKKDAIMCLVQQG
jgi:cysteine desulfuration protein SufE